MKPRTEKPKKTRGPAANKKKLDEIMSKVNMPNKPAVKQLPVADVGAEIIQGYMTTREGTNLKSAPDANCFTICEGITHHGPGTAVQTHNAGYAKAYSTDEIPHDLIPANQGDIDRVRKEIGELRKYVKDLETKCEGGKCDCGRKKVRMAVKTRVGVVELVYCPDCVSDPLQVFG